MRLFTGFSPKGSCGIRFMLSDKPKCLWFSRPRTSSGDFRFATLVSVGLLAESWEWIGWFIFGIRTISFGTPKISRELPLKLEEIIKCFSVVWIRFKCLKKPSHLEITFMSARKIKRSFHQKCWKINKNRASSKDFVRQLLYLWYCGTLGSEKSS